MDFVSLIRALCAALAERQAGPTLGHSGYDNQTCLGMRGKIMSDSSQTHVPPIATNQAPPAAVWLGYSGLLPFFAGVALTLPLAGALRPWGTVVLIGYGAIILSFMGGVHWGAAMMRNDVTTRALGKSVAPSLVALAAVILGGHTGLVILSLGFGGLLAWEEGETKIGHVPAWYPHLRRPLTALVALSLITGAIASSL